MYQFVTRKDYQYDVQVVLTCKLIKIRTVSRYVTEGENFRWCIPTVTKMKMK